jgi:hypothetical protein
MALAPTQAAVHASTGKVAQEHQLKGRQIGPFKRRVVEEMRIQLLSVAIGLLRLKAPIIHLALQPPWLVRSLGLEQGLPHLITSHASRRGLCRHQEVDRLVQEGRTQ